MMRFAEGLDEMAFPGIWMTQSGSALYRVVPKCACSSIGQILYRSDHGHFFDGDIHDAREGLHKWGIPASQPVIAQAARDGAGLRFTCVRNPYARVLSAFFDKVCAVQRNGRRYRSNLLPTLMYDYGIQLPDGPQAGGFDQIAAFRRFLLFARDTLRWRKPMEPDIHWSAISGHVGTFIQAGGRYDKIIWTERFSDGMGDVLAAITPRHAVDLAQIPHFNESSSMGPRRAHPVADYFDDLCMHLMREMYDLDFQLFGYDRDDPAQLTPRGEIDLGEVHARLAA